jgi:AcrR family transcriptional regulator
VQGRSRENRRRIRAAALACFRIRGYNATTLEEIATRSGVPVGGIYLHFKSKRQLLLVLMDELLDALANVPLTLVPGRPRETIRTLLGRAFDRDLEFLGAYRAWQEAVLSDPGLAKQDAAIHRWTRQRVVRTFAALQRLPGARRGVNLETLAAVMDRLFWQLLAEALRTRSADFDRWIEAASDVTFHALFEDRKQRTR